MMSFRDNKKCQLDRSFLMNVSIVLTIFLALFESSLAPAEDLACFFSLKHPVLAFADSVTVE
jgi:hypothetical protein